MDAAQELVAVRAEVRRFVPFDQLAVYVELKILRVLEDLTCRLSLVEAFQLHCAFGLGISHVVSSPNSTSINKMLIRKISNAYCSKLMFRAK